MARRLQPHEYEQYAINSTINELVDGRSNNVGKVTLTPGAATTSVQFPNASVSSMIALSPRTMSAAATQWWIITLLNGSFVIGHDISAATDRTFDFSCVGG
jgi:hypothetical protein